MDVGEALRKPAALTVVENVRCLDCGVVYAKPFGRGTVEANPGCPECGYVGWLAVSLPLTAASERRRSVGDRLRRRPGH
jgi:predicted  nucleic acid-binding Zn-ribbon protein